jgi:hypothetical protein
VEHSARRSAQQSRSAPKAPAGATRGLAVSRERGSAFWKTGFPDARAREGYVSFNRALLATLHAHHGAEDQLVFPRFRECLPDAPYDRLDADHRDLIPALAAADAALEDAGSGISAEVWLGELLGVLDRIAELWHAHIAVEERHFTSETIGAAMSAEEQGTLGRATAEHAQKHAGPDYLVVPFLLYNLEADERAIMAGKLPPVVTQQLIPVAWREKWAPMQPFLLA